MSLVFDSSALLAYLNAEPGGDLVRDYLDDADVPKYAHAINLCEVFYRVTLQSSAAIAEQALKILYSAGIVERNDMDTLFWQDAARLIAAQRGNRYGLALGDSFCVALARRESADIVTADRAEFQPISDLGLASVVFIR